MIVLGILFIAFVILVCVLAAHKDEIWDRIEFPDDKNDDL